MLERLLSFFDREFNLSKEKRSEVNTIRTELASVQRFVLTLKDDLDAAGFVPNKVVVDGIKKSREVLELAIDSMASDNLVSSLRASKVAWIHAFFARSVLDAEMTEQYLGDQNFLELKKTKEGNWKEFVEKELSQLEEEIICLREEIKGETGK